MEEKTIHVLLIENNIPDAKFISNTLNESNMRFLLIHVRTLAEGLSYLHSHPIDVILLDLNLPDSRGLDTMKKLFKHNCCVPVVVISSSEDRAMALEAVKTGAQDYLVKNTINSSILERVLNYAVERHRLRKSLMDSESRLNAIIEKNMDGMLIVDLNGTIQFANPAGAALFGLSKEELVGKPFGFPVDSGQISEIEISDNNTEPIKAEMRTSLVQWDEKPAYLVSLRDVTVYKETEENFKLFSRVIEQTADSVLITDIEGIIQYVNPAFEKITGYKKEEVIGKTPRILKSDKHPPQFFEKLWQTILSGKPFKAEIINKKKNGELIYEAKTITPLFNSQGKITHFVATGKDITDKKLAEKAMEESEKKYRQIVDLAQEGIWLLDERANTRFVNQKIVEMFGYTVEEMIGRPIFDFMDDEMRADAKIHWEKRKQGIVERNDFLFRRKDGSELWTIASSTPLFDEAGNFRGALKMITDITDRKKIEAKLTRTYDHLKRLLESSSAVLYTCKASGDYAPTYVSENVKKRFGYETDEFLKNPKLWQENIHPDDKENVLKDMKKIFRNGKHSHEYRWRHKNGNYLWVYDEVQLIYDQNGQPEEMVGIWIDVTEKRNLEQQYYRAQRMESLGTLAGGVAHDLNNILTPILLATEVLSFKNLDEKGLNILRMIETSAKRGSELIKQILFFARGVEGERAIVQLRHLITEIGKIIKQTFPKSISLSTDVNRELWPVMGDATQLHQVIMNLCVNARDAMPDGGNIEIKADNITLDDQYARMHVEAKPGPYVLLSVTDTGSGIPPEIKDKIFDPFFSTKEVGKGTGLGLATVHSIIKNHGGFINVYSEVGKGTTFKIYLPAKAEIETAEVKKKEEIFTGNGECVLVVDDEAAILEIIKTTLESNGYKVLTATDGAEAVAIYAQRKEKIDLVVTDMSMPYMDGKATIRALRKIDPEIKIIAISGLTQNDFGLKKESLTFLNKPFSSKMLLKSIHESLRKI